MRLSCRITAVAAALAIVPAIGLSAQGKPDFSGRWVADTLDPPIPDVAVALSVRQTLARTNVRGEPITPFYITIAVDREFAGATESETYWIGALGGSEPGRSPDRTPTGPRRHLYVRWVERALVFETGRYTGDKPGTGEWSERREVWSLETGGRLRVAITTRSSAEKGRTATSLYRRQ